MDETQDHSPKTFKISIETENRDCIQLKLETWDLTLLKYRCCRNPTPCNQIQPGTQETLCPIPKAIIFYKYRDLYKKFLKLNSSATNFQVSKSIFKTPLIILKTLRNTYFPEDLLMAVVKNKVNRACIVWKWLSNNYVFTNMLKDLMSNTLLRESLWRLARWK